jgi:ABC-2 type transport system permease protein
MNNIPLLMKREYWEHRGGFLWAPIWITGVILVFTVLGILVAEAFHSHSNIHMGFSLDELRDNISAKDWGEAGNALDMAQLMFGGVTSVGVFFVLFFYLLGALYDDRRDRSVLFWKSLPVSDTATVASKALSAMVVVPVIAFAVATAAYVLFLLIVMLWAGAHGLNALPAIVAAHPLGMLGRLVLTVPVSALWALPAIGWLLFWSAYVRSKPFLWAVMIPLVVLMLNGLFGILGAPHIPNDAHLAAILGRLLFSIFPGSWIKAEGAGVIAPHISQSLDPNHIVSAFNPSNVYGVLAEPNLWIGAVAGLALLAGAIYYRQRRIETAS